MRLVLGRLAGAAGVVLAVTATAWLLLAVLRPDLFPPDPRSLPVRLPSPEECTRWDARRGCMPEKPPQQPGAPVNEPGPTPPGSQPPGRELPEKEPPLEVPLRKEPPTNAPGIHEPPTPGAPPKNPGIIA